MDNKHGHPKEDNGKQSSSSPSSFSARSSPTFVPSPSATYFPSSLSAHAEPLDERSRQDDERDQARTDELIESSSSGSHTANPNKARNSNRISEKFKGNLDEPLSDVEREKPFQMSVKELLPSAAGHGAATDSEEKHKEGMENTFSRSADGTCGDLNGNSSIARCDQDSILASCSRKNTTRNCKLEQEGSNAENASLLFGENALDHRHMLTSATEPSLSQNSDQSWPLEPSFSAPPSILENLSSGNNLGRETLSSFPDVALETADSMQPSSSMASPGLQRAQTLPSGSLKGADGAEESKEKAALMRSNTGKEKDGEGHSKDNVRTPRLSKRKQKKLMKRIATVNPNGTVEFDENGSARFGPNFFGPEMEDSMEETAYGGDEDEERRAIPPLQIVMLIVGTRGDVQPFVAIGKHLQEYGHRVRLATHSNFQDFVLRAGLEFFPLGGDPKVLAGYMVKNKGFLPSGPSEIRTQRKQLKSIINSLLSACTESDQASVPFRAQAIIANPPTYGHVHVAEALKVPLHIFFTMPWTPTSEFPHPLSRVHHSAANRLSYQVVDSLIWWGIRDIINDFRKKKLKLRPITYLSGSQISVLKLPTGYIWSPHLVPKPKDWGSKIDVVGFCFLNMSQDYKPPDSLVSWLAAGAAPIYVGFGSLPVEDPQGMTEIIVEALSKTSQRGIIVKGWGGIGILENPRDSIYLLENCPHDWLFPKCAAVVHHGGAGTTAAGLRAACPTTIVPFFGDQPFWGDRVHAKGVGPAPIPVGQFSLDKLVYAINYMMKPQVKERAVELAKAMEHEDGVVGAVNAFHKHLPREMPQGTHSISSKTFMERITGLKFLSCFGSDLP